MIHFKALMLNIFQNSGKSDFVIELSLIFQKFQNSDKE